MNWADQLAPRYHLSLQPDGGLVQTRTESGQRQVLAFDRQTRRFVSIHLLPPRSVLSREDSLSVGERVYLAGRISHPCLFNVIDYGDRSGCLFYVTELEEGEPLPAYLARLPSLPFLIAFDLAIQLVALLRYLANFPRILGNVVPEDLLVAPSPGHLPCIRLSGLGLHRPEPSPENPGRERQWPARAAHLLWQCVGNSLREDPQFKFATQGSSVLLDPFREFLHRAQAPSADPLVHVFQELEKDLHRQLDRFLEMLHPHRWPTLEECVSLRPRSLFSRLLIDEGILSDWTDHNFEFAPELFWAHSRYALAAKDIRTGNDIAFQVLPSGSLIGDTGLEGIYRNLGHARPKEEGRTLRTFFLRSEPAYAYCAEEAIHGFSLADLMQRRGHLLKNEACELLERLDPSFQELEDLAYLDGPVAPWNICISFDPAVSTEDLALCVSSLRVHEWPSCQLRLRLGPTLVDLTRPIRGEWEEILLQIQGMGPTHAPAERHPLDLSFAALAVFLLEYRRYRSLLVGGMPRPRVAISCARLQSLLTGCLLAGKPHHPSQRSEFLDALKRSLASLSYPGEDRLLQPPAGDPAILHPAGLETFDASPQQVRQNRVALLQRLLRRESSRLRMKRANSRS